MNFDIFFLFTQSAVHQSFAKADNLGEISAKAQVSISVFLFCLPFFNLFIRGLYYEYLIYCRFKQSALTFLVLCLLPLLICGLGTIKGCYFIHDMKCYCFCFAVKLKADYSIFTLRICDLIVLNKREKEKKKLTVVTRPRCIL